MNRMLLWRVWLGLLAATCVVVGLLAVQASYGLLGCLGDQCSYEVGTLGDDRNRRYALFGLWAALTAATALAAAWILGRAARDNERGRFGFGVAVLALASGTTWAAVFTSL